MEILYRGSCEADGVRSRGGEPHLRQRPSVREGGLASLGSCLARGDLLVDPHAGPLLYVCDGRFLLLVPGPPIEEGSHHEGGSAALAKRATHWLGYWERSPKASWLLWWNHILEPLDKLSFAAVACDCAESVLRFAPEWRGQSRRALRLARLRIAGQGTEQTARSLSIEVEKAVDLIREEVSFFAVRSVLHALRATFSRLSAMYAAEDATLAVSARTGRPARASTEPARRASQSLAYLVRARIPAWRFCLALAEKEGP